MELSERAVQPYYFADIQYHAGIAVIDTKSGPVRNYDPEKTLCDMFRFKNMLGSDLTFEALKQYLGRRRWDLNALMGYAEVCRVKHEMTQYLKAILG